MSPMLLANEQGRRALARRPRPHRSEFPPAIPRRVAPQQSPLPLRRIKAYTSLHEPGAIPRRPTCHPISLSHHRGAVHSIVPNALLPQAGSFTTAGTNVVTPFIGAAVV